MGQFFWETKKLPTGLWTIKNGISILHFYSKPLHEPKILLKSNDWKENNIALPLDHAVFLRLIGQNKEVLGQNQRLKTQKPDFSYEDFLIHKQAYQNPGFTLVNPTLESVYRKQVVLFIPIIFFWGSLTADFSNLVEAAHTRGKKTSHF